MRLPAKTFSRCNTNVDTRLFPATQEDIADVEQAPVIVGIIEEAKQAGRQSSAAVKRAYVAPHPQFAC